MRVPQQVLHHWKMSRMQRYLDTSVARCAAARVAAGAEWSVRAHEHAGVDGRAAGAGGEPGLGRAGCPAVGVVVYLARC